MLIRERFCSYLSNFFSFHNLLSLPSFSPFRLQPVPCYQNRVLHFHTTFLLTLFFFLTFLFSHHLIFDFYKRLASIVRKSLKWLRFAFWENLLLTSGSNRLYPFWDMWFLIFLMFFLKQMAIISWQMNSWEIREIM